MSLLVGVTTSLDPAGGGHRKPQIALYANYLGILERIGLTGVLLTPAHSPESIERLMGACSGLLLTGGEDVEPSRYGEDPIPELGDVHPGRDAMEFQTLDLAMARGLPVLAICRGAQVLNVHLGGTLYQDIEAQCPEVVAHYQSAPWGEHQHQLRIEPDSLLGGILGSEPVHINSYHHQAIKELAPGLRITAVAEDGLVEAVETTDGTWVLGVQWHPERHEAQAPSSDPNLRVIQAFAERVRRGGPD